MGREGTYSSSVARGIRGGRGKSKAEEGESSEDGELHCGGFDLWFGLFRE